MGLSFSVLKGVLRRGYKIIDTNTHSKKDHSHYLGEKRCGGYGKNWERQDCCLPHTTF